MPRWKRRAGDYLVKSRKISDGELLHLLTGKTNKIITDFDRLTYSSLQTVKSSTFKWILWIVGFSALGILAHFNVVKAASAAGLEIAPTVFGHVALIGLTLSSACFCFSWTKQPFLQAWFAWKLKSGTPALRAECLLTFPDAYWHFSYLPGNIGYPPHYMARRGFWMQLVYLLLVLVALLVFAAGSLGLWFMLAGDVLASSKVNHNISVLTVTFCAAIGLLGWLSPFYYDIPRTYTHFGLVNLLNKLEGERNSAAHRRLIRVADRMGLIKWPSEPKNNPTTD